MQEIDRHDPDIAIRQQEFEIGLRAIYARVAARWNDHASEILEGRCGYSILGALPVRKSPLLIIGLNPGYDADDATMPPHRQTTWPLHAYLDDDRYPLKDRLKDLLDSDPWRGPLSLALTTNFLFFRSRSLRGDQPAWQQVPLQLRRELQAFCLGELQELIDLVAPKRILVLGMTAVGQYLYDNQPALQDDKGNWLIAKGHLWGRPAIGIKHPTGARWTNRDWQRAKIWFSAQIDPTALSTDYPAAQL
ncbi:hypothetical protein [Sphingomonas sp. 22R3R2A-7]|uniref:hypothetical protein n=1 Tax=Sphingomonas sp. 22R3R2A-7 TaxID=3050230 RepID=UPI002FE0CD44